MPTGSDILNYQKGTTLVFDQPRYPRAAPGNAVKVIREMRCLPAKRLAAEVIANALAASSLPRREMTIVGVVGSVVSADLWKHPCGVHHLLIPAVRILRGDHGASFSLDGSPWAMNGGHAESGSPYQSKAPATAAHFAAAANQS